MIKLTPKLLEQILQHAHGSMPRECCGVLWVKRGKMSYVPMRNIAERNEHFVIHPEDYAAAEDSGSVVAIVHSHPDTAPMPSMDDRVGIEKTRLPWVIVNPRTGAHTVTEPSGFEAPLIGRPFSHGVLDCYTLIRDYYRREMGIALPDYTRDDEWWLKGQNCYVDNFDHAGFYAVRIEDVRIGDMIVMQVGSPVPNHGAVYVGDSQILHHVHGRYSSRDVYGGWWRKVTTHVMRHKEART